MIFLPPGHALTLRLLAAAEGEADPKGEEEITTLDRELARVAKTLRERPYPTRFAVEICADCNLACSMCHHPMMRRPKGNMPFVLWQKCADQLAAKSRSTQCWFSFCGEPLLQPERLVEMIRYGKSVGLRSVNINTNGMLLTSAVAELIIDSGADLIVFGIDGFRPEVYEQIRVGADRDVVYANVEHFLALRRSRGYGPEGATLKVRNKLSWGGKFETPLHVPPKTASLVPGR